MCCVYGCQVHEVLVCVEDPGCVITWDFDVMRQDVTFSVLRTEKPLPKDLSPGSQGKISDTNNR